MNLIGVVETDIGVNHPEYFDYAREALIAARRRVKAEAVETQRDIQVNQWILSVLNGNLGEANAHISELLALKGLPPFDSWETVSAYKSLQVYFERRPTEKTKAKAMWQKLEVAGKVRAKSN
jgi:uncharacterized protein YwgA